MGVTLVSRLAVITNLLASAAHVARLLPNVKWFLDRRCASSDKIGRFRSVLDWTREERTLARETLVVHSCAEMNSLESSLGGTGALWPDTQESTLRHLTLSAGCKAMGFNGDIKHI